MVPTFTWGFLPEIHQPNLKTNHSHEPMLRIDRRESRITRIRAEKLWGADGSGLGVYSRAREGGHGPRPECPRHRRGLGRRRRRRRRGRIGQRGGRRDRGGAEGGVGEEPAGAGVPEHRGGSHCVASRRRRRRREDQRSGEEVGVRWV